MVSTEVDTAAPAEVEPWPVLASALVKALRAAAALALTAVVVPVLVLPATGAGEMTKAEPGEGVTAGEIVATGGVTTVPTVVAAVTLPAAALVVAVPAGVAPESDT